MHKYSEQPEQSSLYKIEIWEYWFYQEKCIINTQPARWIFSSQMALIEGGWHGSLSLNKLYLLLTESARMISKFKLDVDYNFSTIKSLLYIIDKKI